METKMKLVFHWHSVLSGHELYLLRNNMNIVSILGSINFKRLYILTKENPIEFMRLTKYKETLKKL